jgi:cytochrome bd-type quinol oxidase subunit 2
MSLFSRTIRSLLQLILVGSMSLSLFGVVGLSQAYAAGSKVVVEVTERIPGADCDEGTNTTDVTKKKYKCTVEGGFGSVQKILGAIIKYATFITALCGVLMIVYSGIEYAVTNDADGESKKRIGQVLAGLVLLFLVGFILNTIAPWIYQ